MVKPSQKRYGVSNDGMILYLENLTVADTAGYTCQVEVDRTTFKRYGSLEVLDTRKTNLASSASCCKLSYSLAYIHPSSFPDGVHVLQP